MTWEVTCEKERMTLVVQADVTSHWLASSNASDPIGRHCSADKKPDQSNRRKEEKRSQSNQSEQKSQVERSDENKTQSVEKQSQSKRTNQKKSQSNLDDSRDRSKQAGRNQDKSSSSDSKGNQPESVGRRGSARVPTRQEAKELQKAFRVVDFVKSAAFGLKHSEPRFSKT